MKKLLTVAIVLSAGIFSPLLKAQTERLKIDVTEATRAQKTVQLNGTVIEVKKYSFVVDVNGQTYHVKPEAGIDFKLRLEKPFFNLEKNVVIVSNVGATKPDDRTTFNLKATNYIQAYFAHDRQKKRIMAAKVKRLNHYEISPEPFESQESKDGEHQKLTMTGKLVRKTGRSDWVLRNADTEEYDIALGYQNAKLGGFSLYDLKPGTSVVQLNGVERGDYVEATTIEFWPKSIETSPAKKVD